jgi:DNA polymerase-1
MITNMKYVKTASDIKTEYLVADYETDDAASCGKKVNPIDPETKIVCGVYKLYDTSGEVVFSEQTCKDRLAEDLPKVKVIVGHNIAYDLHLIWKDEVLQQWLADGGLIFDTAMAQYLLSGQAHKFPSLDECSIFYGGTLKDDRIKTMYQAGMKSSEIPKTMLEEYCLHDGLNTEKVFLAQVALIEKQQMWPLIWTYMDHILALVEMEHNGVPFDIDKCKKVLPRYRQRVAFFKTKARDTLYTLTGKEDASITSNEDISLAIFGGTYKVEILENVLDEDGNPVLYGKTAAKAGQIKTRKAMKEIQIDGLGLTPKDEWQVKNKPGLYKVSKTNLLSLQHQYPNNTKLQNFINQIIRTRKSSKLLTTYLEPYLTQYASWSGAIHGNLNATSTVTGRLSAAQPNLQNVQPVALKYFKVARPDHYFIEFDFSQIEVVIQAFITQCDAIIQDILDGVDFHALRLSYILEEPYEQVAKLCKTDSVYAMKRKKIAKPISFAKAYGAFPDTISENTDIPVELIEKVFQGENQRYKEVAAYYECLREEVVKTRRPLDKLIKIRQKDKQTFTEEHGEYAAQYKFRTVTRKIYTLYESASQGRNGVFRYLKQTTLQNYPIQGTAADLVSMQVGRLFRYILKHKIKFPL